jgi:hypothetical protein
MTIGYFELGGQMGAFKILVYCFIPVACIWFPDHLGSATGFLGSGPPITKASPAAVVAFLGWVLLLMPILIIPIFYLA